MISDLMPGRRALLPGNETLTTLAKIAPKSAALEPRCGVAKNNIAAVVDVIFM
jgi:hypothetical protein